MDRHGLFGRVAVTGAADRTVAAREQSLPVDHRVCGFRCGVCMVAGVRPPVWDGCQ